MDEAQYKINFKSRVQVKGGITGFMKVNGGIRGFHESERQELKKTWGGRALQSAEKRLKSLGYIFEDMPVTRNSVIMPSPDDMRRDATSPSMTAAEPSGPGQDEAIAWIPQATPDGRLLYSNIVSGTSTLEEPSTIPTSVNRVPAKDDRLIGVSESNKFSAGAPNGAGGNHMLQDYQTQLMLLEQRN